MQDFFAQSGEFPRHWFALVMLVMNKCAGIVILLVVLCQPEEPCDLMTPHKSTCLIVLKRQGFTLVEIMITLVIIAVTAAIATPSILSMAPNMALKTAARDLYSQLQQAKMLAIKENNPVSIRFNASYYYADSNGDGAYTPSGVDTFTDTNGDGVYNTSETYSDVDGNGKYSGEIAVNFIDYGYGINLGTGNATANWSGNPCVQAGMITFTSRGSSNNASIYLENKNGDVSYAVTVRAVGSIRTRKYNGAAPFNKKYWD